MNARRSRHVAEYVSRPCLPVAVRGGQPRPHRAGAGRARGARGGRPSARASLPRVRLETREVSSCWRVFHRRVIKLCAPRAPTAPTA